MKNLQDNISGAFANNTDITSLYKTQLLSGGFVGLNSNVVISKLEDTHHIVLRRKKNVVGLAGIQAHNL